MSRSISLPPDEGYPGTQSIGRAVHLLRCIASHGLRGLRADDIVQMSGLSKTTCVRVLRRLVAEGLVAKDTRTEKFFLGALLSELGLLARPRHQLEALCELPMQVLADVTHDTVYLSERSGNEAICTARRLGSYPIQVVTLDVGVRRPLGVGPGGLALLAAMPSAEREAAVAANASLYRGYGALTARGIIKRVTEAAARGFYVGPSFGVRGTCTVSMGFCAGAGVGALSVSALADRMPVKRQEQIAQLLARQIAQIGSNAPAV